MKNKFLNLSCLVACASIFFTGCIKNNVKELGDAGKTFLKIAESPENKIFFTPFSEVRKVSLVSIQREANSSAELNKPVTVNLRVDTAAVRAYNTKNSETFKLLPDSLFTVTGAGITKTGNLTYQLTFAPGEFAKDFQIGLNGAKWNLSEKYAMPFIITDPGGLTLSSGMSNAIALVSIKNKWDGVYTFSATYDVPADRPADWVKTFTYGFDVLLATTGVSSVRFYNTAFGPTGTFIPLETGAGPSGFGATTLDIVFGVNDKVISVNNPAPDSRNRQFKLIEGANSYYDASSKTLFLEMTMSQVGFAPIPMHIVMKYKKSR